MSNYVWYACYGSNINYHRFLLYIIGGSKDFYGVTISNQGCRNKDLPILSVPYLFAYPIYFAKPKNRWNGGVAFLDTSKKGLSYGRAYLITEEQFLEVKEQEGIWYQDEVDLGVLDGYQVKTFTGHHLEFKAPSVSYINTIRDGLLEINMSDQDIENYLKQWI